MDSDANKVEQAVQSGRLNRRSFLKFCGFMTTVLSLPMIEISRLAGALASSPRLPVVWLEFQDCAGDTESFLRASAYPDPLQSGVTDPSIVDLLLNFISLEYHETVMVPAGFSAENSLDDVMTKYVGQYLCVVEGGIPAANNGVYCTVRGKTALSIVQEVTTNAKATIAAGDCAWDGGISAASPNPTGAAGVRGAVPGLKNLLNLPGCPTNVVNTVASIVYLITYNQLPPADSSGRPYFAYGDEIHENCERHNFYEKNLFVRTWGDEGHRKGWCLYQMGCKGPETKSNCPRVKWNDGACWPVAAGHGCIGCAAPRFWDAMTPFYQPLPDD
jgi:hydrogenase small subunit